MLKFSLISFFSLLFSGLFGQAGTSGDPFTALGQAWNVPSSGIYHFNISGTTFSSYVEATNGWILMASGSDATDESSYATTSNLTLQSDQILPSSIYTSTLITTVRMNATSGPNLPFDVQSSAAAVLGNLQNDRTLSVGTNNTDWSGTGTSFLGVSGSSGNGPLDERIYHAAGNRGGMHWQVGRNNAHERVTFDDASKSDLNLWIRANTVALPIELLHFDVKKLDNNTVQIDWQTASEINNDFFTVERSKNTIDWETINTTNGSGNSSATLAYSFTDNQPFEETSYYRLKQTDFDGTFSYSKIVTINNRATEDTVLTVYPNPTSGILTLKGEDLDLLTFNLYNSIGLDITSSIEYTSINKTRVTIDLQSLKKGFYFIQLGPYQHKVFKE